MPLKNVLGVSAGNGVILHPLRDQVIANIEGRSDYYIKGQPLQWNLNFSVPMVKSFDPNYKNVDIIIGHPKCGLSSMFALSRGKTFKSHEGEPSLDLFIQAVNHYKPKLFLLENLPKFLESFDDVKQTFKDYALILHKGSVSDFGNSQVSRKRLVMVGLRLDSFRQKAYSALKALPTPSNPKPVELLLKNLPENGNITEPIDDIITMYSGFKISLLGAKVFWRENPHLRHWPVYEGKMNTAPGVYINRTGDFPLTVRKTNRQFNPIGEQMSPRELARIQGIPDGFELYMGNPQTPSSTIINKGRVTVANTPPYEIGLWFSKKVRRLKYLFHADTD